MTEATKEESGMQRAAQEGGEALGKLIGKFVDENTVPLQTHTEALQLIKDLWPYAETYPANGCMPSNTTKLVERARAFLEKHGFERGGIGLQSDDEESQAGVRHGEQFPAA